MTSVPPKTSDIVIPPIKFFAGGRTEEIQTANLDAVLPSPGFPTMALILADAMVKRCDVLVFDFTVKDVGVRYNIDGFWHTLPTLDRETGDFMLASMKRLADLDINERRARQEGKFAAEFLRKRFPCRFVSQGVKTGERVAIYIERRRPPTETLEECGMRPALIEKVKMLLGQTHGLLLVSGLPGDGFTTAWRATLNAADRFMRDFFVVEDTDHKEPEVINVTSAPSIVKRMKIQSRFCHGYCSNNRTPLRCRKSRAGASSTPTAIWPIAMASRSSHEFMRSIALTPCCA